MKEKKKAKAKLNLGELHARMDEDRASTILETLKNARRKKKADGKQS